MACRVLIILQATTALISMSFLSSTQATGDRSEPSGSPPVDDALTSPFASAVSEAQSGRSGTNLPGAPFAFVARFRASSAA